MMTITPLSSILPIGSATARGNKGRSQEQPFPGQGQLLKALVLESKGENRFVLDIGGTQLNAKSEAPLSTGQKLQLQVMTTSPQIELKIVTDTLNQFLGRSLTLIGKNIDLSSLFKAFQQHSPPPLETVTSSTRNVLETFYSQQQNTLDVKGGGVILKQLIDGLGLTLENLLAKGDKSGAMRTLKAALIEISQSFHSADRIADTTNKLLNTLELFQLAQLQTGSEKLFIFPLPLPFLEQGYLIVENNEKENTADNHEEGEGRFSLHLTMKELGNIQIDFLKNREELFIRFRVEHQEIADFVSEFREDLEQSITNIPLISISFSTDAPDPISDLIQQLVPEGRSIFTTKA
jgi:hypothetical protein